MSKSKKTKEAQTGITDVLKQLWQAAVTLRGSIEAADYKRYVLPLIFLRFLSLRYERRRQKLEQLVKSPQSDYYTKNSKIAKEILNDPDEYRSTGAFIVPEKARWSHILDNAQRDNIKVILDDALEMLENTYPEKLHGLLPRIYAGSNLEKESVVGLINLFSKDIFKAEHGGEDLVGRVYEYFIGEFASSEGKRGGEYFTPASIVKTLVAMLEPKEGIVFDPCCGSGGMFVQSDIFTKHNHKLSFIGQESKDFTYRLCRMNLFIHVVDGNIQLGNSYFNDKHAAVKADYILANPPFNDGSKSENGWGADRIPDKDSRLSINGKKMPLANKNANTMWIMHFLHHLQNTGTAGFVMATGELSSNEGTRLLVRKTLVDENYVDCVVRLPGQLFANTQIPCSLWFLSKNRSGLGEYRKRTNEVLFIDARQMASLLPGSRRQKYLCDAEIENIANLYRKFRYKERPKEKKGFCTVATLNDIKEHKYALVPGRYVGAPDDDGNQIPYEEKLPMLITNLKRNIAASKKIDKSIENIIEEFSK